ncbi:hypothetical protein [Helicobacter brantae]|uniref:Autotransporter domain-containing protein n=1 Tax=Helicobacter brantae TaxID=375927 RepID=A0A3D8IZF2_9HELI|nr:hypothetical protein [Helicobacter brantae]RDU70652.1 hypothetical protein CQA58_04740 [Helicobacter brantae]
MRKSYIVLSLILSQALCADDSVTINKNLIANFYTSTTTGNLKVTKPNSENTIPQQVTYGTEWTGGTNYLNVNGSDLTFNFSDSNRQAENLILSNGLTIKNNIASSGNGQTQAKVVFSTEDPKIQNLIIGQTPSSGNKVSLGSNINLKIENFSSVNVASNLYVASNSTFDVSTIENVTNDGGIVLEGKDSKLVVKETLTNNGTIMMKEGSSIESSASNDLKVIAGSGKQGSVIVLGGGATIQTANNTLTLKSQNITLRNLVSKDSGGNINVATSTLTFKNTNNTGTLTLGDSNAPVSIVGDVGNPSPSTITPPQGSEIGKVVLSGFNTINASNVSFKNIALTSTTTNSMTLDSGTLGLENTTMSLGSSLSITGTNASTITLTGQNTISTTGALTIQGTHNFQGDGTLDFVGNSVNLGNGTGSSFALTGSSGSPTIGVSGGTINTNEFSLTGLTLQAIGSSITNTNMTLSNSTLEAIDNEGNLASLTITKGTTGTIDIANGTSATLSGTSVTIEEQTIELKNTSQVNTTLNISAKEGFTLGKQNGGETKIQGSNDLENNILNLNTPLFTLKGKVTLEKLTINTNQDLTIVGTESYDSSNSKGLFLTEGTTISTKQSITGGSQYSTLSFMTDFIEDGTPKDETQAYVSITGATTKFEASNFVFQNQNISLSNSSSGATLELYAYGTGVINGTNENSGVFTFTNTTFSNGSSSTLKLYGGSGGVSVTPTNLTLNKVSLTSCLIGNFNCSTTADNSLDLSSSEGSITILGGSTISATKLIYGDEDKNEQGIGVDISVGSGSTAGQLTITSTTASDSFVVGGNITLNNTINTQASDSLLKISLNNSKKLEDNTLSLEFRGGGVTAIGTSTNKVTLKAKDFTFSNLTDSSGAITSTPFVKVQNTELNLNGTNSTLDLVGTLYLSGDSSNEAKFKATNGGAVKVTLHDINAEGKASVTENQLEFSDSNIFVGVLRDENGNPTSTTGDLTLKDSTTPSSTDPLSGTIASITLDSGALKFQNNSSSDASITLNSGSAITSSGTSSLTLKTIKVGNDSSGNAGLYSLNVSSGTFTLKESTKGDQLGAITLGSESSQGGNGGNFIYQNGTGSTYNDITLKDDITSYGSSSISAQSFTISAKSDKENYTISSSGGELKLIAQDSSALSATADIILESGSLGYYGSSNTLSSLTLSSSSSVSATGNSTLQASGLNLGGASVSASGGTLTLKGVSSSTTAGNVSVGNGGVLTLQNSNTTLASLSISEGSKLSLSANVPYVTSSSPLGGGKFGQVVAQSVKFESKSGTLVQISLNTSSASSSSYDDSLFALREGEITLIDTKDGITKKTGVANYTSITLDDITTNTSGLTSITLTPYLQSGTDSKGQSIEAQKLLLNLSVSQTNVTQLIESIQDSSAKESMTSIINSGNNASILESILQSDNNAFKVGMAEYISSGNTAVVQTALEYIDGAMSSLEDSMFASNKIYELIAMLRTSNVENRMVRGKNPFMAKTRLSSLIQSLTGTRYASSDDSLLLEEEESGVNYGELWANFDGAMSFSQEVNGNSSLYGFSAGYDTLLGEQRNYLLGFFASYGYGAYSFNYARNNSHNFGLGLYTRMSFENSEVDIILSQNIGLNHTEIDLGGTSSYVAQALKQTLGYNFYTTDIEARYGYVFKVGNEDSPYYFRPFGGINFALIINSSARGDGEAELGIQAMSTYQLSVNVGVEMRKYFGEENYLYLLPILQKGLLNDGAGAKVGFYGAENLQLTPAYNVDTSMSLLLGGVGNVGENIAVSGGVGVKYGFEKKDILTNWNVGLRYKF